MSVLCCTRLLHQIFSRNPNRPFASLLNDFSRLTLELTMMSKIKGGLEVGKLIPAPFLLYPLCQVHLKRGTES